MGETINGSLIVMPAKAGIQKALAAFPGLKPRAINCARLKAGLQPISFD
jgi:hypothetical protein